jgi:transcriptional regulator with XRE-family HTH domain
MGLEIINQLKKNKGLTSEELSKKSGVPLGTLNKILSGVTKDPKLETLRALAKTLDCNLDDFDDNKNNLEKNNDKADTEFLKIIQSLNPDFKGYALMLIKSLLELQEKIE